MLAVAVFCFYLYINFKRLGGNLGSLAERQAAQTQGENPRSEAALDEASKPTPPASALPSPAPAAAPVAPEIVPTNDGNRAAASALALASQNNSPTALLTPLAMPAVKSPGGANTPLAVPTPGNDASLLVHVPDKGAGSKPQKVSNNALE